MSSGRFIFRGYAQQGWRAAGRALADGGVSPLKAYGRFIAGQLYQSTGVAWQSYQGGTTAADVYQSQVRAGQIQ